jgi:dihydroxyacetone kinase phosphotransfer subunit
MIGIVVVSHSAALASAAVDLALQMGGEDPPVIEIAAGTADGGFGTDAVEIAGAIDRAAGPDGVLVVMDLGSAVLSAEMALEFRASEVPVALSPGPFVEGLIAAVVLAAAGADLDTIAAEAAHALAAKRDQLGDGPASADGGTPGSESLPQAAGAVSEAHFDAIIDNPSGLHARPAALFVKAASRHDADVQLADLDRGAAPVSGRSLIALMALGVRPGTRVRVSASGPEAAAAIDELRALVDDGFGER